MVADSGNLVAAPCCLIRPLESDSEFSLPKQRSKVVAHKAPRIQYCGGPGDVHPTHSSSQLATPLSQWIFQGTSSGTRSTPHPWTYRPRPPHPACFPRDSGHKWPVKTGDLTSEHPEFLTSQIRETVHQWEKSMENDVRGLWGMGERI